MKKQLPKAIRVIGLLWLLCYLFMVGGCGQFKGIFTTPVVYDLKELSSPMNEFIGVNTPSHKKIRYEGSYIGVIESKGREWKKYHFKGVLTPSSRVLEILVGNRDPQRVLVREVSQIGKEKEQAVLLDHCFCGECVPKMSHEQHHLYTNALGSDDYICSKPKRLNGNHYSGGFTEGHL